MIKVPIPQTLHNAVARAERVLNFCRDHVFVLPPPSKDPCWHAGQALLHVMHDQLTAARLYAEQWPHRPYPIMVLVRPIYEAMLQLLYLLRPDSEEERRLLGRMFWSFQEVEIIEGIAKFPGGVEAYAATLSEAELRHHSRRTEISKEAKAQSTPFSLAQKKALERGRWSVTWTGRTIADLARELGKEAHAKFHMPWYGVMSMATHVTPGMIHWAYKLTENQNELARHTERRVSQSAEWLNRGGIMVFRCSQAFLQRYGVAPSEASTRLDEELRALRVGSEERREDEDILRSDPKIRDLVGRLESTVHPRRIILFGSAARGDNHPNSDFDVLVVMPDGTDLNQAEDAMYRCMRGFGIPVDLIAVSEDQVRKYRDNPNLVIHTATTEGKEIYSAAG